MWRATLNNAKRDLIKMISIHALRVEGDLELKMSWEAYNNISIHALRVEGDQLALYRGEHSR